MTWAARKPVAPVTSTIGEDEDAMLSRGNQEDKMVERK